MKSLKTGIICCALILQCVASWAVYGVRISDLNIGPLPPNPIRVWGKVTSEVPLKISDGRAEITVNGWAASVGVYLTLTGNWDGSSFTVISADNNLTTEMISIPAGSFLMGNSGVGNDAVYGYSVEFPQHSVTLAAYSIGKYEVTRGEYRQFMNAGGYSNSAYWSTAGWSWNVSAGRTEPYYWAASQDWGTGNFTQTDSHPVVGVTYYEAEAFCNWAGGHLATEAQWERAARWTGSHPNVYPWGDTWNQVYCNNFYDSNSAGGGYQKYQTAPVGSYSNYGSPSGFQDMAGNVWEWCQDWYKSYPGSTSPFDYTNSCRVLRGGSWNYDIFNDSPTRCAYRSNYYGYVPSNGHPSYGFRLCRSGS